MTATAAERYSARYSARYCERTSGAEIEIDHRGRDRGRDRGSYRALSVVVRCKFSLHASDCNARVGCMPGATQ